MRDYPIYIDKASHLSKIIIHVTYINISLVLSSAVQNDSSFLCSHSIIDYSLLVGIVGDEIVVGMIDFIRTFTWDKKWEYELKTHFTPGSTPPTILHPEKYKERFVKSVKKYFNPSPTEYHYHLKSDL